MATVNSKTISKSVTSTTKELFINDIIYRGDVDAYTLEITFSDISSISGTCNLHFVLGDGTTADRDNSDGVTITNNVVTFLLESSLYSMEGLSCWVQFKNSNVYTPLKLNFTGIRIIPMGDTLEVSTTKAYPKWAAEVSTFNFDELNAIAGNRTYTEQNYVTDSESVTDSIDALDTNLNLVQEGGDTDGRFTNMPFVGTAPIVESGSNANGSYVKYADGTMIQHGITNSSAPTNALTDVLQGLTLYRTGSNVVDLPQAFIDENYRLFFSRNDYDADLTKIAGEIRGESVSASQFRFQILGCLTYTITATILVAWFAIGRWKA